MNVWGNFSLLQKSRYNAVFSNHHFSMQIVVQNERQKEIGYVFCWCGLKGDPRGLDVCGVSKIIRGAHKRTERRRRIFRITLEGWQKCM